MIMKIPNLLAPRYLHSLLIKAKIEEQNGRFLTHYAAGTLSGLIRGQALDNAGFIMVWSGIRIFTVS